jgi:cellulose synthase/poly-beta-1,6-N-acetylglucosamine synthase-like glycosyltransferase
MMRLVFWSSFAFVWYAYAGYPAWLFIYARLLRQIRPILKDSLTPTISIIIAARNEEAHLAAKLENLRTLNYPRELIQLIVVSDGSKDGTAAILESAQPEVLPVLLPSPVGKALALNEAVRYATGEMIVFLDVRQMLDVDALVRLVSSFADPTVGAASGELILQPGAVPGSDRNEALGVYWSIEKAVRRLESASGSVVGATGAIYAIRRELYTIMPAGTILDDVFIPMHIIKTGKRVVFEPGAIARDQISTAPGNEFRRKVRTLTGNYQLLRLAPWLLTPANPLLFRFISHKLLRLLVPLFLVLMLLGAALLKGPVYHAVLWMQVFFYAAAGVGMLVPAANRLGIVRIAVTFSMLNLAAVVAFCNFLRRREQVWR